MAEESLRGNTWEIQAKPGICGNLLVMFANKGCGTLLVRLYKDAGKPQGTTRRWFFGFSCFNPFPWGSTIIYDYIAWRSVTKSVTHGLAARPSGLETWNLYQCVHCMPFTISAQTPRSSCDCTIKALVLYETYDVEDSISAWVSQVMPPNPSESDMYYNEKVMSYVFKKKKLISRHSQKKVLKCMMWTFHIYWDFGIFHID